MQLYDHPVSPNCRKVRVYCAEKGLHVALRPVALLDSEQRTPEFLQRNPFGAIPILELDDGTIVPESLAIIEYLEELHPSPPLLGDDPLTRALVRAWERRCELGIIIQGTRRYLHSSPYFASRGVEQNPKVVEEASIVLKERLTLINDHLQNREWLTDAFSLSDITLMVGLDFIALSQFQLDPAWTHLIRWHETMQQRPSATV